MQVSTGNNETRQIDPKHQTSGSVFNWWIKRKTQNEQTQHRPFTELLCWHCLSSLCLGNHISGTYQTNKMSKRKQQHTVHLFWGVSHTTQRVKLTLPTSIEVWHLCEMNPTLWSHVPRSRHLLLPVALLLAHRRLVWNALSRTTINTTVEVFFPRCRFINAVRSVTSGMKKSFSSEIFKNTRILKMKENV